jgi:hypothetical protein
MQSDGRHLSQVQKNGTGLDRNEGEHVSQCARYASGEHGCRRLRHKLALSWRPKLDRLSPSGFEIGARCRSAGMVTSRSINDSRVAIVLAGVEGQCRQSPLALPCRGRGFSPEGRQCGASFRYRWASGPRSPGALGFSPTELSPTRSNLNQRVRLGRMVPAEECLRRADECARLAEQTVNSDSGVWECWSSAIHPRGSAENASAS